MRTPCLRGGWPAISCIYLDESFVRVIGKGNKERIVPMGEVAVSAVRNYLAARPEPYGPEFGDTLFLNRFGKSLSRVSMFGIVKRQAMLAGIHKEISRTPSATLSPPI